MEEISSSSKKTSNLNDFTVLEKLEEAINPFTDNREHEYQAVVDVDLATRVFYAQRSIEKQYMEVKDERFFGRWNKFIKDTLFISKLQDDKDDYLKWDNTNLSIRTSNWYNVVGLLTSEILGAALIPQSFGLLGYVPSNIFLIAAFSFALLSGYLIWWLFLLFDSPEYPIKTMADIAEILLGKWFREFIIFLQLLGMLFTTAAIVIAMSYCCIIMREDKMCYVGLVTALCVALWVLTHIKQLNNLGKLCLVITVVNYTNLFLQMGFMSGTEPNWDNAKSLINMDRDEILTYAVAPQSAFVQIIAIANLSFVFAGSMVFPEVISEMNRPWDFWKSAAVSQGFILVIYLLFGNFIYSQQGQFSNSPAVFGLSNQAALKTLCMVSFVTSVFQALFYSNVSSKIVYKNYVPRFIKNIKFYSKKGLILWVLSVSAIWIVIWIISAAVPQVSSITAFTSSLCMIPLTYTTPYLFHMVALWKKLKLEQIEEYNTSGMKAVGEKTTWKVLVKRGYKKYPFISTFHIVISFLSLIFCILGICGSVGYIIDTFNDTPARSFSCSSPI